MIPMTDRNDAVISADLQKIWYYHALPPHKAVVCAVWTFRNGKLLRAPPANQQHQLRLTVNSVICRARELAPRSGSPARLRRFPLTYSYHLVQAKDRDVQQGA